MNKVNRCGILLAQLAAVLMILQGVAHAEDERAAEPSPSEQARPSEGIAGSDKLLLTGGVSQLEGAAGGGLTPWAVIGGYGTRDQFGANAFYTRVDVQDYHLDGAGALIGFLDRIELSIARQQFNTESVGEALGLGRGFTFRQDIIGLKVRVIGDAVLDQDSWVPQIALGAQFKRNDRGAVLAAIGARNDQGHQALSEPEHPGQSHPALDQGEPDWIAWLWW